MKTVVVALRGTRVFLLSIQGVSIEVVARVVGAEVVALREDAEVVALREDAEVVALRGDVEVVAPGGDEWVGIGMVHRCCGVWCVKPKSKLDG